MRRIKIPQQYFVLKMQGGLMCEGGAYLRDTTVLLLIQSPLFYSLGDNEIGDKGATNLADTLRVNHSLKTLRYLFSDLQRCMFMLIKLRLFHCNIAEQVKFFIIVIFHCSLYHSGLTSTGAVALAKALQQNKSLEELK